MGFEKRYVPSPAMGVAFAALIVAAGGVAVAAIPGPSGTISTCYANRDFLKQLADPLDSLTSVATPAGTMRAIEDGAACDSGETKLTFNQRGPAGPAGARGARGPASLPAWRMGFIENLVTVKDGGGEKVVRSFPLPKGNWLVTSDVRFIYSGKAVGSGAELTCSLFGPGKNDTLTQSDHHVAGRVARAVGTVPLLAVGMYKQAGKVELRCSWEPEVIGRGQDLSIYDAKIIAVKLAG